MGRVPWTSIAQPTPSRADLSTASEVDTGRLCLGGGLTDRTSRRFGPQFVRAAPDRLPEKGTHFAMRIYIGNLDYSVTSDDLRNLFAPFGEVEWAEIQAKSRTGRSRGFGLVDMPNEDAALAAINALNGKTVNDRPLRVNESRPRRTVRDLYASGGWYGR